MFSIIIPALNEETYLPLLLADLCLQTGVNFEVIVVDGGSTDQTRSRLQDYQKKLTLRLIRSPRANVGYQRNLGAQKARYSWLLFLDADLRLQADFLKLLAHHLQNHQVEVGGTISRPLPVSPAQPLNLLDHLLFGFWNCWIIGTQYWSPHASGNCIFITRRLFHQIKGFNPEIKVGEDIELVRRAARVGRFRILPTKIEVSTSVRRFRTSGYRTHFLNLAKYSLNLTLRRDLGQTNLDYQFGQHRPLPNDASRSPASEPND